MPNPASETTTSPFVAFNFAVEINLEGESDTLCSAAFSDCDGLDVTMDVKTIREGGNNGQQIRFPGGRTYGQVTLKRGMTSNFDLWDWVEQTLRRPKLRAKAEVVILAPDGQTERARFILDRCLPVKLKSPSLSAKDGMIAVEELQIAFESLTVKKPEGAQ
jgi:phage tail-like protein